MFNKLLAIAVLAVAVAQPAFAQSSNQLPSQFPQTPSSAERSGMGSNAAGTGFDPAMGSSGFNQQRGFRVNGLGGNVDEEKTSEADKKQ